MKIVLMGAACAFAFTGAAAAQTTGFAGGAWQRTNIEVPGGEADVNTWSGEVRLVLPVSALGLQFDGEVSGSDFNDLGLDDVTLIAPTAHVFLRTDMGLIGGFVGWQHAENIDFWGGGAEAQLYLDRVTLDGALSWGSIDDVDGLDIMSGDAEVRFFVTDNLRLDGGLSSMQLDGGGDDTDMWTGSLGAEFRPDGMPVSFTAGFEHSELEDFELDADTFRLGVRFNFGGGNGTLLERDRNGPSLGDVGDRFGGAFGQGLLGLGSALFDVLDEDEGEGGEEGEGGDGGEGGEGGQD